MTQPTARSSISFIGIDNPSYRPYPLTPNAYLVTNSKEDFIPCFNDCLNQIKTEATKNEKIANLISKIGATAYIFTSVDDAPPKTPFAVLDLQNTDKQLEVYATGVFNQIASQIKGGNDTVKIVLNVEYINKYLGFIPVGKTVELKNGIYFHANILFPVVKSEAEFVAHFQQGLASITQQTPTVGEFAKIISKVSIKATDGQGYNLCSLEWDKKDFKQIDINEATDKLFKDYNTTFFEHLCKIPSSEKTITWCVKYLNGNNFLPMGCKFSRADL